MPITQVGSTWSAATNATGATSLALPAQTVTAGNTIVLVFASRGATLPTDSVTDTLGLTFSNLISETNPSGLANINIYVAKVKTGGSETITLNSTVTAALLGIATEFKGVNWDAGLVGSMVDGTVINNGSSTPSSTGTTAATRYPGDLAYAAVLVIGSNTSFSSPAFSPVGDQAAAQGGTQVHTGAGTFIASATGYWQTDQALETQSFSVSGGGANAFAACMVTLYAQQQAVTPQALFPAHKLAPAGMRFPWDVSTYNAQTAVSHNQSITITGTTGATEANAVTAIKAISAIVPVLSRTSAMTVTHGLTAPASTATATKAVNVAHSLVSASSLVVLKAVTAIRAMAADVTMVTEIGRAAHQVIVAISVAASFTLQRAVSAGRTITGSSAFVLGVRAITKAQAFVGASAFAFTRAVTTGARAVVSASNAAALKAVAIAKGLSTNATVATIASKAFKVAVVITAASGLAAQKLISILHPATLSITGGSHTDNDKKVTPGPIALSAAATFNLGQRSLKKEKDVTVGTQLKNHLLHVSTAQVVTATSNVFFTKTYQVVRLITSAATVKYQRTLNRFHAVAISAATGALKVVSTVTHVQGGSPGGSFVGAAWASSPWAGAAWAGGFQTTGEGGVIDIGAISGLPVIKAVSTAHPVTASSGIMVTRTLARVLALLVTATTNVAQAARLTLFRSYAIAATTNASVQRAVSSLHSLSPASGVSAIRRVSTAVAAMVGSSAVSMTRAMSTHIAVAASAVATAIKQAAHSLSASLSSTVTVISGNAFLKAISIAGSATVVLGQRTFGVVRLATSNSSFAMQRAITALRAFNITPNIGMVRAVTHAITMAIPVVVIVGRRFFQTVTIAFASGVALTKQVARTSAATLVSGVTLIKRAQPQPFTFSASVTATLGSKAITKSLSVLGQSSIGIGRALAKAVVFIFVATVTATKQIPRAFVVASTATLTVFSKYIAAPAFVVVLGAAKLGWRALDALSGRWSARAKPPDPKIK